MNLILALAIVSITELKDIKSVAIAPDGKTIACVVAIPELKSNRVVAGLWLLPVGTKEPKRLELDVLDHDTHS